MALRDVLRTRLLFVTGKGGTGKTSLAAAIGRLGADRGRRTLVVEIDSQHPALTGVLGVEPRHEPRSVAANLDVCNLAWRDALEAWIKATVPAARVVRLILNNRVVQLFLDATPGVREMVLLSSVLELMDGYDQVIVDMPASGHAVSMLRVPHLALRLMPSGPIRDRSEQVLRIFRDPGTALIIVALPEEMVVNETLELEDRLRELVPELRVPMVVLNRSVTPSMTEDEHSLMARLAEEFADDSAVAELVLAGRWESDLEMSTAKALTRLDAETQAHILTLPRLGTLGGFQGGPHEIVRQMSNTLARKELGE